MSLRMHITRRADLDLLEIAEHIARDNPRAAIRFLDSAVAGMRFLAQTPKAGPKFQTENLRLAGLRKWSIRGFRKYLIFYRVDDDAVRIIRVVHGARDLPILFDEL
jgi:toxin ParE1/3/4